MRHVARDFGTLVLVPHDDPPSADPTSASTPASAEPSGGRALDALVGRWLSYPEIAELTGVSLSRVRGLVADRELVAIRRGKNRAWYVPADFVTAEGPRPEVRGTITVLSDGGMSDEELLEWLFTPDDTLPVPGTPMNCLLAGHKTEVRRRAMETAF